MTFSCDSTVILAPRIRQIRHQHPETCDVLHTLYHEIFKTLKPGDVFGIYELLMTKNYDVTNIRYREIRLGIEKGSGIST